MYSGEDVCQHSIDLVFFKLILTLDGCQIFCIVFVAANAVLTSDFRVLKLIDWDFLKDANEVGSGSGSPGYAAPEVTHSFCRVLDIVCSITLIIYLQQVV